MKIRKIRWKNLLSYGNNFTEYNFENGIDIIFGKNGKGKSCLLDALLFGFFGKPFRKVKLGSLVNNKNNKELVVEIEFEVTKRYKIIRGLKPNIFEIYQFEGDWKLIPQDSHNKFYQEKLEEIIGMNEILFRQIVLLGANISNVKNFMDLSSKEKEEIFQNLTNTFIFNIIVQLAKEKKKLIITDLTNLDYQINTLETTINNLKLEYEKIEKQNKEILENKEKSIKEINENIESLEDKINKIKEKISIKESLLKEYNDILKSKDDLESNLVKINTAIKVLENKKKIFEESEEITCPKCGNIFKQINIDLEDINKKLSLLNEKYQNLYKDKLDLEEKISNFEEKLEKIKLLENKISSINIEINQLLHKKKFYEETKITEINYDYLKEKEKELQELKEKYNIKEKQKSQYEKIISLIIEGKLKEQILSQQLPLLNKFINEYLEKFGVEYNFIIENNLKEKIIRRGESQEFNALSNGQKQRIVLSLLFGFLKIMKHNGYEINILVLDEFLDSSLDDEGIQIIIDVLENEFSKEKDIIIITHNPNIKNKLNPSRIYEVKEEFGYSKLEERE
jgi:DNA repair exonuclease SbcCD ATPase subunit